MKQRLTCLILSLLLLAGLTACGQEPAETPDAEVIPAATAMPEFPADSVAVSYADAYVRFRTVCGAVWEEVGQRLDAHNTALEAKDPTNYYMDPQYLMLVYTPFQTGCPSMGSALTPDTLDQAADLMRTSWPDVVLTQTEPNVYQAEYSYTDPPENGGALHQGLCVWEFAPANGAFRVTGYVDGILTEFTEFVPQGSDTYLLYTMTDKALVTFINGEVTALCHAHRISEPPLGDFAGDMRLYSLDEDDPYPHVVADSLQWITDDPDLQYVINIAEDEMTYTGQVAESLADGAIHWTECEPFTLQK